MWAIHLLVGLFWICIWIWSQHRHSWFSNAGKIILHITFLNLKLWWSKHDETWLFSWWSYLQGVSAWGDHPSSYLIEPCSKLFLMPWRQRETVLKAFVPYIANYPLWIKALNKWWDFLGWWLPLSQLAKGKTTHQTSFKGHKQRWFDMKISWKRRVDGLIPLPNLQYAFNGRSERFVACLG